MIFILTQNKTTRRNSVFFGQKFVNVINFDVLVPRLATKNISEPNDSKLLSIKIESKQFKSNFNPHFITTIGMLVLWLSGREKWCWPYFLSSGDIMFTFQRCRLGRQGILIAVNPRRWLRSFGKQMTFRAHFNGVKRWQFSCILRSPFCIVRSINRVK